MEKDKINVLIVDDEELILEQCKHYLIKENEDFNISGVKSVKEGLNLLSKGYYDVVISDYKMPERDGLDLLKEMKDRDFDIPFIVFTGRGREEVAIKALNLGADRYIQKGNDPKSQYKMLASAVESSVQHKRTERSLEDRRNKIEALHLIAADMEKCRNEQEVYDLTVDAADNILEFSDCSILVHEDGKLVMKATHTEDMSIGYEFSIYEGIYGLTYREKKPFMIGDMDEHEEAKPTDPEYKSILSLPIGDIGVFQALSKQYDFFDINDLDMANLLISHTKEALTRIRIDKARRKSEKKYRNLVENTKDIIYSVDLDGTIKFVSSKIKRFGYQPSDIIGKNIDEFLSEEDMKKINEIFPKFINGDKKKEDKLIIKFKKKDGDIAYLEENSNVIKEEGEVKGITGVLREVTEREKKKD